MKSQITTKKGDAGTTQTLGGDLLTKGHIVLECTGQVDALRAHTALVRLHLLQEGPEDAQPLAEFLFWLLHTYFLIGTEVNDPACKHPEYRQGAISADHLAKLEKEQAALEEHVHLPQAFIVSAGNALAAEVDVLTTVARTLERSLARLSEAVPEFEGEAILAFANRLSDYFYLLARHLDGGEHRTVDYELLK